MRATKVLLIESARSNGISFAASLKRKYDLQIAHSGKHGLALAQENRPDVIVLDAVSMRTSGDRICTRLRNSLGDLPIIHIRPKKIASGDSVADVMLSPPFTSRKLINRIERFADISDQGEVLRVGRFLLNLEQNTLVTGHNEQKLTPKLSALMEIFMRSPNETLARKDIMQNVWKTDYMGDTRTLDVHIRWLRKAVEPNPRKPRYVTTVRGVGYRLVIDDDDQSDASEESPKPAEAAKPAQKKTKKVTATRKKKSTRTASRNKSTSKAARLREHVTLIGKAPTSPPTRTQTADSASDESDSTGDSNSERKKTSE